MPGTFGCTSQSIDFSWENMSMRATFYQALPYGPTRQSVARVGVTGLPQPEHLLCIAGEDHSALLFAEARWDRHHGIVEIPVRIVGREQDAVEADPAHGVEHVGGVLRLFHRL